MAREYGHYFKDVSHLNTLDIYRVIQLWNVTDPSLQHALKKIMCAGGRGAKDVDKDVQEAIDALKRFQEMRKEDAMVNPAPVESVKVQYLSPVDIWPTGEVPAHISLTWRGLAVKDLDITSYSPRVQGFSVTNAYAVKVFHHPTGLHVTCEDERSAHRNKATALKALALQVHDFEHNESLSNGNN